MNASVVSSAAQMGSQGAGEAAEGQTPAKSRKACSKQAPLGMEDAAPPPSFFPAEGSEPLADGRSC